VAPPKRVPPTAEQIAEKATKLHAAAQRWWRRLSRAFRELEKINAAIARLRRAARKAGHT